MGILDIFKAAPPAAPQQGSQQQGNPNDPSSTNVNVPGNATPGNDKGNAPAAFPLKSEGDKSPLDGYVKMWETDATKNKSPSATPTFDVDPKKLMDAARNVDFAKAIPADILAKAAGGDVTALGQAINVAAQVGYAQSAAATTKIVEQALAQQAKVFHEQVMPDLFRKHSVSQTLASDTVLSNQTVKPVADFVKTQVAAAYPNASAADIEKHTQAYFKDVATEILKSSGMTISAADASGNNGGNNQGRKDEDWGKFFNVPATP
jgi:hypothetical protein